MVLAEVSTMSKQLPGLSRSRLATAGTALTFVLAACGRAELESSGRLEVLPSRSDDVGCDAVPGQLRFDGIGDDSTLLVSGEELCNSRVISQELPAGLYGMAWEPSGDAHGKRWVLSGPSIVSVFPGQVTRLRLRQIASDRSLLSRAP
jgi:hypothetical protein